MSFDWKSLLPPDARDWLRQFASSTRERAPPGPSSSVSNSNMGQWFGSSAKDREQEASRKLYVEVKQALIESPFADEAASEKFLLDMIVDICNERGVTPSEPLGNALWSVIAELIVYERMAINLTLDEPPPNLTMEEGVQLRALLTSQRDFLRDHERLLPIWRRKLVILLSGVLSHFPLSAFTDVGEDGQALDDSILLPEAKALALCEDLPLVVQRSLLTFFDEDISNAHLFDHMRETLERNSFLASGIPLEGKSASAKVTLPTDNRNQDSEYIVSAYLGGTPLEEFFSAGLPFAIPFPARFEHTHIIGGTGHGKTQLMQFLIHHDLVRAKQDQRSVVVIDSQGDLIRTMSRLQYFSPDAEGSLSDRFVMIDPTDIEHPVALNMFDFNRSRLSGFAPLDREKILNATVELYEYFFGALLGAELTQRQGLIFRYLARLLIEIPGATIHTLRELMEDGEKFLPHMETLQGTARAFFATRFFDKSFNETKKQILARLWGVLSNSALERMFSHRESKIDVFDLMNSGKIIFINTAKDLLGQDGAAIFGRFFVALIAQAAVQRSAIPAHERNPCFVYIDEAQDYFDESIANLLTQARKYRVGLIFAHQSLDQLGPELRGSVLSNTTIKFAGGVSAKDATAVAQELRCDGEFVLAQKRGVKETHFACWVRNYTGKALSVSIPLGFVESLPKLSTEEERDLKRNNRATYTAPAEVIPEAEFSFAKKVYAKEILAPKAKTERANSEREPDADMSRPTVKDSPEFVIDEASPDADRARPVRIAKPRQPPPDLPTPGRGGQEHKYLQHLVKQLAEERGFRATIEEQILGGAGEVDVSLSRGKRRIACEISVTTSRDHELQNVEKCLAAGYTEIVLVGSTERHAKSLAKFIEENLEEGHGANIRFASPDVIFRHKGTSDFSAYRNQLIFGT